MPARELGPDHGRLRAAVALGAVGDGLLAVALPLLAAGITRDPVPVAGVVAAQRAPWLLAALLGPRLAAAHDRRTPMGLLRTLRALAVGALGLAELLGGETLLLVYAVAFVAGAAEIVSDELAADAALAGAAPGHAGRAAGGIAVAGLVAHGLVGLPAAGVLFSVVPALPILLDTLASSLAALLLLLLAAPSGRRPLAPSEPAGSGPGRAPVPLTAVGALASAGTSVGLGVLVLYALEAVDLGPTGFGLLLTAAAGGALVGGWLAPELGRALRAGPALAAALVVAAAGHAVVALAPEPALAAVGMGVLGLGDMAAVVLLAAVRHAAVHGRGDAHRWAHAASWGAVPVGALAGGAVAAAAGVRAAFVAAAVALVLAALAAVPATRRAGRERAAPAPGPVPPASATERPAVTRA